MGSNSRAEYLVERLAEEGYRLTPQRLAVVHLLASSKDHPSAAHLHKQLKKQFPTMSLATVYKTVDLLARMGELQVLGFDHDDNRYDGNPYPHPHLVCTSCRRIVDLDTYPLADMPAKIELSTGYKIYGHRMEFYGLCPECQNEQDHS